MTNWLKLITLCLMLCLSAAQQPSEINPSWVRADYNLIETLIKAMQEGPNQVEQYYRKRTAFNSVENLGFGWTYREAQIGAGFISIKGFFYYKNSKLVSYAIHPQLPHEQSLVAKYRSWYAKSFTVTQTGVAPFSFNEEALQRPVSTISSLSKASIPVRIGLYMSPASGVEYGHSGGFASALLDNRKSFLAIRGQLKPQDVLFIMHAVNPASRLTAIEYYWQNKNLFNNREDIDKWVEQVFKELPQVKTMFGCTLVSHGAKELVGKYSQKN
ncbi:hypothetical protein [Hymenobacter sp. UYP22]|uniref:hypothetical protein n=1 Tax=Hymenobacter sp. UYP22 TaxID=3156348 RepID=UPI0033913B1E